MGSDIGHGVPRAFSLFARPGFLSCLSRNGTKEDTRGVPRDPRRRWLLRKSGGLRDLRRGRAPREAVSSGLMAAFRAPHGGGLQKLA